ncbi:DNA end-binding protein Ku [Tamaricihabitans halophyticus]|uniref:Non-homologous end joining protein Ku n=1 Tax=Tamaricihabitans halophyticus TaxID=1262583 RepID=A0A4R2Q294_9PSEU|nr:Ku protein [Tamaricihabitans halophyticus]TCP42647.1 DNA end-binding protein Ku [Tamaricihabitans halophyticus]
MARPLWRGALNFGLVTVPVELFSATEDHTIHFRQFERGTSDRIRYRRVNERTAKEVEYDDIVKGHPLDGSYVLIEQHELDEIAPGRSRTIDIDSFVHFDEIDPVYFRKSYWLGPAKQEFDRAYGLLAAAMRKTNRAGIATFVMRNREHVAVVRTVDNVLVLDTLQFADEIRAPESQLPRIPAAKPREKELDMAVSLIESMSEHWQPERYQDTYTQRVHELIEEKKAGRTVQPEPEPAAPTNVVDLLEALSASVRGRATKKRSRSDSGDSGRKETPLAEWSKADLRQLARELDIKGRSTMNRAELMEAVHTESARHERVS